MKVSKHALDRIKERLANEIQRKITIGRNNFTNRVKFAEFHAAKANAKLDEALKLLSEYDANINNLYEQELNKIVEIGKRVIPTNENKKNLKYKGEYEYYMFRNIVVVFNRKADTIITVLPFNRKEWNDYKVVKEHDVQHAANKVNQAYNKKIKKL